MIRIIILNYTKRPLLQWPFFISKIEIVYGITQAKGLIS